MSDAAKILVVDDTPANIKLFADLLTSNGYAVTTAVNGEEALAKLAAEKPDLILLDVMIPKIDGIEVCRLLKKDSGTKNIPIIMLTVMGQVKDLERAFAAGADDYLIKPFQFAQLLAKIDKFTK